MIVVGVGGCKGGWLSVAWNTRKQTLSLDIHGTFSDLLDAYPAHLVKAIGIDMPIGLIACKRAADREARAALTCRKPSVFPAPDPRVACVEHYHAASALSRGLCGKGISAQAFGIYRKVCEVNSVMTPELQARVIEIHPEVCFWAMNHGADICESKKTASGSASRLALLKRSLELPEMEWNKVETGKRGAKPDDVLDAVAAAWTARRWVNGSFGRFPAEEERDANGLRAEIVY